MAWICSFMWFGEAKQYIDEFAEAKEIIPKPLARKTWDLSIFIDTTQ